LRCQEIWPEEKRGELEYQLLLARDLGYLPSDAHAHLAEQVTVGGVCAALHRLDGTLDELIPVGQAFSFHDEIRVRVGDSRPVYFHRAKT
jgi:hypothetical protein